MAQTETEQLMRQIAISTGFTTDMSSPGIYRTTVEAQYIAARGRQEIDRLNQPGVSIRTQPTERVLAVACLIVCHHSIPIEPTPVQSILFVNDRDHGYTIPGGIIQHGESSKVAMEREIAEEVSHQDIVKNLSHFSSVPIGYINFPGNIEAGEPPHSVAVFRAEATLLSFDLYEHMQQPQRITTPDDEIKDVCPIGIDSLEVVMSVALQEGIRSGFLQLIRSALLI